MDIGPLLEMANNLFLDLTRLLLRDRNQILDLLCKMFANFRLYFISNKTVKHQQLEQK